MFMVRACANSTSLPRVERFPLKYVTKNQFYYVAAATAESKELNKPGKRTQAYTHMYIVYIYTMLSQVCTTIYFRSAIKLDSYCIF